MLEELKQIILDARAFCVTDRREDEIIREWAREEGYSLTRGMVRKAKEAASAMGMSSHSQFCHKYHG